MTSNVPVSNFTASQGTMTPCDHSRYLQRVRRRYSQHLSCLPQGLPTQEQMQATLTHLQGTYDLPSALRILRHLLIERLACLDCEQQAPLLHITHTISTWAEIALNKACEQAFEELDAQYGPPLKPNGERVAFWIVAMGKLGARELNVSSDIDLIYLYEQEGETTVEQAHQQTLSFSQYFGYVVKRLYQLIGETTEHGWVFRIDLALRPHGNSGPAALSLLALEKYLLNEAREWERLAWLKSRVVAPFSFLTAAANQLRPLVLPFVFRHYLDYKVFQSLRELHQQIREFAQTRAAGHPDQPHDVKLSRGGIREIEFIVQLLQVVRGGQFPELRTRSTLTALTRLNTAQLISHETAQQLSEAYIFLRKVEHRIQYLDDQQTHLLPNKDDDLSWIASTMQLANVSDFLKTLHQHREFVAITFDALLGKEPSCTRCDSTQDSKNKGLMQAHEWFEKDVQKRVLLLLQNPKTMHLKAESQQRLLRIFERTALWLKEKQIDECAILRMLDWIEPLLKRENYLALLQERPTAHLRLLQLLGVAQWPFRYLMRHPSVIDELANEHLFQERFDAQQLIRNLQARKLALASTGEDDDEALLNLIRRAHHIETFRTLARDIEGALTVEQVADDLSALADTLLQITLEWTWERLKHSFSHAPCMGIIAYGKLGGKELGYGSDLDIVFIYQDTHESAQEVYAAWVRKLIHWLTLKTSEGDVYEIDTALRPNGNSGLLVCSIDSFIDYQTQQGHNSAWTWEHQALTRARFVTGPHTLAEQFERIRYQVMAAHRDRPTLQQEIIHMREKLRQAHPIANDVFDVKHSAGGMLDIEFAVQYLLLSYAERYPELTDNIGNIALLERAQTLSLLPSPLGHEAAQAYRTFRRIQHNTRLNEKEARAPLSQIINEKEAGLRLWQALMLISPSLALCRSKTD